MCFRSKLTHLLYKPDNMHRNEFVDDLLYFEIKLEGNPLASQIWTVTLQRICK